MELQGTMAKLYKIVEPDKPQTTSGNFLTTNWFLRPVSGRDSVEMLKSPFNSAHGTRSLCWSGTIKSKTEGSWTYVGKNKAGSCFRKLRSYYQITARPWHPEEEEEENEQQKGEM